MLFGYVVVRYRYVAICCCLLGMLHVVPRTRLYCCSFFLGMLVLVVVVVVVVGYVVVIGYIAVCCRRCWVCCSSYLCILLFVVVIVNVLFFSFMFDEPSSYLDVKQRLKAALAIRSLLRSDR